MNISFDALATLRPHIGPNTWDHDLVVTPEIFASLIIEHACPDNRPLTPVLAHGAYITLFKAIEAHSNIHALPFNFTFIYSLKQSVKCVSKDFITFDYATCREVSNDKEPVIAKDGDIFWVQRDKAVLRFIE